MNKEISEKWVAALRSGEYHQGKGVLRTEREEYCVLGVLCDLAEGEWVKRNHRFAYVLGDDQGDFYAPCSVLDWAEIKFDYDNDGFPLIERVVGMNDSDSSFEHIADFIEQNWENM